MTPGRPTALEQALADETARRQPDAAVAAARHAAARHGGAVRGVLYYGSCLRTGILRDRILDFYLIVDDYRQAYDRAWLSFANHMLPPNVFYDETKLSGEIVRAKYAVLSLDDLQRRCRPEGLNASVWARFCQPTALLLCDDAAARRRIIAALSDAVTTMLAAALPLSGRGDGASEVWSRAFSLTYSVELRSEPEGKGREIYELDRDRYDRLFPLALAVLGVAVAGEDGRVSLAQDPSPVEARRAKRVWLLRRVNGKSVSFLRLIKAAFTFDGGIDYLAWKIARHSGVKIEVTPWQRRHPILAGLLHFLRLRLRGAFR